MSSYCKVKLSLATDSLGEKKIMTICGSLHLGKLVWWKINICHVLMSVLYSFTLPLLGNFCSHKRIILISKLTYVAYICAWSVFQSTKWVFFYYFWTQHFLLSCGLLHKLLRLVLQVSHLFFFFKTGQNLLRPLHKKVDWSH